MKHTIWTIQWVGFYTLVQREWYRMCKIASQVFLPPVMTTFLYQIIFGTVMTKRIGLIHGHSYISFIAPGLVMMAVIINSYSNVSSSVFLLRFQKSIEEILVSPLHPGLMLLGFCIGGVLRGIVVSLLVLLVFSFFEPIPWSHMLPLLGVISFVALLFSLAGFTNAILARTFDDIAIVPTFLLTPLSYLGGVFYTRDMLPTTWQHVMDYNPIFYMINALRHVMIGSEEVSFYSSMTVILALVGVFITVNLILLKKGTGLKA